MIDLVRSICLCLFTAASIALGPAVAAPVQEPAPVVAAIKARPAMWTVRSPAATAYLFGSIHILPLNIDWHSPAIDAALAASDIFVFEAPIGAQGQQQSLAFVRENGTLPAETSLPSLLDANSREDYRAAVLAAHVPPELLVHMRPWLAALVLQTRLLENIHYSPAGGVDHQVWAYAEAQKKQIQTFETIPEQLQMLMPKDRRLEMEEFDASLKDLKTDRNEVGALVDAWSEGRMDEVAKLMNAGLSSTPGAKKLLIDDRNARWMNHLAAMLSKHHTYFITVGAGHLAGPHGLPALLAARGYQVKLSTPEH
ncbi:MAG TPA: TraB/GumN family protein [Rhizomicrobium sp.]|jgi:hypothetical protein|nr:TraB/GumN family protein [Rhizomicrobium sp.]